MSKKVIYEKSADIWDDEVRFQDERGTRTYTPRTASLLRLWRVMTKLGAIVVPAKWRPDSPSIESESKKKK